MFSLSSELLRIVYIVYNVHHIQYKTSLKTMPSLNVNLNKKININQTISNFSQNFYISRYTKDFSKFTSSPILILLKFDLLIVSIEI